jgi:hypothetical protein
MMELRKLEVLLAAHPTSLVWILKAVWGVGYRVVYLANLLVSMK